MKIAHFVLLIILVFIVSCRKDEDTYRHVPNIPGFYQGEAYYRYANSYNGLKKDYNSKIFASTVHSVTIGLWPTGISLIPLEVSHEVLTINNFIDTISYDPSSGATMDSHIARLNGTGSYNPITGSIYIEYAEERASVQEGEFKAHSEGYISVTKQ